MKNLKVIAFDADDTLWINEPYFQEAENKFCELLEDYLPKHSVSRQLLEVEIDNLRHYGYGIKSFMLSMVECALRISNNTIGHTGIERILEIGKNMMHNPIELIDGVETVLKSLRGKYRLVMATKGDLFEQERKLIRSGLEEYFHHIEIVSEKKEPAYRKLIKHLDVEPSEFMMLGNSLKSDILPVLEVGGHGVHVPFHTTWEHEKVDKSIEHPNFIQLEKITDILDLLV